MEKNRVIFSEDLRNVGNEGITIGLPINMGFYSFNDLDYERIDNILIDNNIQPKNNTNDICRVLEKFIIRKIKGMLHKTDINYYKYETAFYEKNFCKANKNGQLKNEKFYQNYIKLSKNRGLITIEEIEKIENDVFRRYIKNSNMLPQKKNMVMKKEIYTLIKSRSSYIRNCIMFSRINDLEDFIAHLIIKEKQHNESK